MGAWPNSRPDVALSCWTPGTAATLTPSDAAAAFPPAPGSNPPPSPPAAKLPELLDDDLDPDELLLDDEEVRGRWVGGGVGPDVGELRHEVGLLTTSHGAVGGGGRQPSTVQLDDGVGVGVVVVVPDAPSDGRQTIRTQSCPGGGVGRGTCALAVP